MKTQVRKRRDGYWFIVETARTLREYGPYPTRDEANRRTSPPPRPAAQPRQLPFGPPTTYQMTLIDKYRALFNRVNASDLELAEAIKIMAQAGIGQQTMADQLGNRNQSWFSYMYRLSEVPESLKHYLRNNQISTTALVKGVSRLGPTNMERKITAILARHARHGIKAKIIERELYE